MKKIILFFVVCQVCFAQNEVKRPALKFGEVPIEDVKMSVYAPDSSADVVVLYDHGRTFFEVLVDKIHITTVVHERIKILKKSGLSRGSFKVETRRSGSDKEFLLDVKGFTYNLQDGQLVKEKLTKDMIFEEKSGENAIITKISLPNVKEGSVIEYTYRVQTPISIQHNPNTWYFQQDVPVLWSDYSITIPSYFNYRMLMSGYLQLHAQERNGVNSTATGFGTHGTESYFAVKDAPAFKDEDFITTSTDYLSKIDFELTSLDWPNMMLKNFSIDYPAVNETLLESSDFGEILNKRGALKDIATQIRTESPDTTIRIQKAMQFVRSNIKWNEKYSIYSAGFKKILEKKEGDSGDINLILIALLREIGFDAHPVILSTRGHGRIHEQYALLKRFNYVVGHVQFNGKDLFLDATDEFLSFGMLPYQCLSHHGWYVHPKNAKFISLEPTHKDVEFEKAELKIDEEGEMKGTFTKSYVGYSAAGVRSLFKKEGKEKFLEGVKKTKSNWTINQANYSGTDAESPKMEATYELSIHEGLTTAGNMMYLNPMLGEGHGENPFKDEDRTFPVDFAMPIEETFMATYEIPAGYSVVEMPKSVVFALPENGGKFTYAVSVTDNKISVVSRLGFRKSVYGYEEYPYLKSYYDKIVQKHQEQIVLKKN